MVSNASDDLPDPETPVTTVNELCGISTSMFLRLWTRAPRTVIASVDIRQESATLLHPGDSNTAERPLGAFRRGTESFYYKAGVWRDILIRETVREAKSLLRDSTSDSSMKDRSPAGARTGMSAPHSLA